MGARRARGGDGGIRALCAEAQRHLAGRKVHNRRQDEERRDPIGPAFEQDAVLAFDDLEPADAAADQHTDASRIRRLHAEPARLDRHGRRGNRELDEASTLLDVLLVHPVERIEPGHLAGEPAA